MQAEKQQHPVLVSVFAEQIVPLVQGTIIGTGVCIFLGQRPKTFTGSH